MSGAPPPPEALVLDPDARFAIAAARWHAELVDSLLAGAVAAFAEAGVDASRLLQWRVPGCFELAWVAQRLARAEGVVGVVALGVVVRGDTPHFDYVCQACAQGLTRVALDCDRPVGFGVITADTMDQARHRAGWQRDGDRWVFADRHNKGRDAALAVLELAALPRLGQ